MAEAKSVGMRKVEAHLLSVLRNVLNGELVSLICLGQAHILYRWEQFCKPHGKENRYSSRQHPSVLWTAGFCCVSAWYSSGTGCKTEVMIDLPKCIEASIEDKIAPDSLPKRGWGKLMAWRGSLNWESWNRSHSPFFWHDSVSTRRKVMPKFRKYHPDLSVSGWITLSCLFGSKVTKMALLISPCLIHLPSQPYGKHRLNPRALQLFQFIPSSAKQGVRNCLHKLIAWQAEKKTPNQKPEPHFQIDVLGHTQCLYEPLPSTGLMGWIKKHLVCILALRFSHSALPKNHILNKDENLLLLKSICSSLQRTSGSPVKDFLVFWPPVVWDIQKICATSAGTFKWTHVAPGIAYIGLIKIHRPGKWELSYLEKQPTSSLILRQRPTVFNPACPFPLLL